MTEENKMTRSKLAFNSVCNILQLNNVQFTPFVGKLKIECRITADIPISLLITINPEYEILLITSILPFAVEERAIIDSALAINMVNYKLVDGSFDFNIYSGTIRFRMTSSYRESLFSRALFEYMIKYTVKIVDKYDNMFFCLSSGAYNLQEFAEEIDQ